MDSGDATYIAGPPNGCLIIDCSTQRVIWQAWLCKPDSITRVHAVATSLVDDDGGDTFFRCRQYAMVAFSERKTIIAVVLPPETERADARNSAWVLVRHLTCLLQPPGAAAFSSLNRRQATTASLLDLVLMTTASNRLIGDAVAMRHGGEMDKGLYGLTDADISGHIMQLLSKPCALHSCLPYLQQVPWYISSHLVDLRPSRSWPNGSEHSSGPLPHPPPPLGSILLSDWSPLSVLSNVQHALANPAGQLWRVVWRGAATLINRRLAASARSNNSHLNQHADDRNAGSGSFQQYANLSRAASGSSAALGLSFQERHHAGGAGVLPRHDSGAAATGDEGDEEGGGGNPWSGNAMYATITLPATVTVTLKLLGALDYTYGLAVVYRCVPPSTGGTGGRTAGTQSFESASLSQDSGGGGPIVAYGREAVPANVHSAMKAACRVVRQCFPQSRQQVLDLIRSGALDAPADPSPSLRTVMSSAKEAAVAHASLVGLAGRVAEAALEHSTPSQVSREPVTAALSSAPASGRDQNSTHGGAPAQPASPAAAAGASGRAGNDSSVRSPRHPPTPLASLLLSADSGFSLSLPRDDGGALEAQTSTRGAVAVTAMLPKAASGLNASSLSSLSSPSEGPTHVFRPHSPEGVIDRDGSDLVTVSGGSDCSADGRAASIHGSGNSDRRVTAVDRAATPGRLQSGEEGMTFGEADGPSRSAAVDAGDAEQSVSPTGTVKALEVHATATTDASVGRSAAATAAHEVTVPTPHNGALLVDTSEAALSAPSSSDQWQQPPALEKEAPPLSELSVSPRAASVPNFRSLASLRVSSPTSRLQLVVPPASPTRSGGSPHALSPSHSFRLPPLSPGSPRAAPLRESLATVLARASFRAGLSPVVSVSDLASPRSPASSAPPPPSSPTPVAPPVGAVTLTAAGSAVAPTSKVALPKSPVPPAPPPPSSPTSLTALPGPVTLSTAGSAVASTAHLASPKLPASPAPPLPTSHTPTTSAVASPVTLAATGSAAVSMSHVSTTLVEATDPPSPQAVPAVTTPPFTVAPSAASGLVGSVEAVAAAVVPPVAAAPVAFVPPAATAMSAISTPLTEQGMPAPLVPPAVTATPAVHAQPAESTDTSVMPAAAAAERTAAAPPDVAPDTARLVPSLPILDASRRYSLQPTPASSAGTSPTPDVLPSGPADVPIDRRYSLQPPATTRMTPTHQVHHHLHYHPVVMPSAPWRAPPPSVERSPLMICVAVMPPTGAAAGDVDKVEQSTAKRRPGGGGNLGVVPECSSGYDSDGGPVSDSSSSRDSSGHRSSSSGHSSSVTAAATKDPARFVLDSFLHDVSTASSSASWVHASVRHTKQQHGLLTAVSHVASPTGHHTPAAQVGPAHKARKAAVAAGNPLFQKHPTSMDKGRTLWQFSKGHGERPAVVDLRDFFM